MFETGDQVLESLRRIRDRSEAAISAVEQLLSETRKFSQAQAQILNQTNGGTHESTVSLADFVQTATYAINGGQPILAPSQPVEPPPKLTAAQFASQFINNTDLHQPNPTQSLSYSNGRSTTTQTQPNSAQSLSHTNGYPTATSVHPQEPVTTGAPGVEEQPDTIFSHLTEDNPTTLSPTSKRNRVKTNLVIKRPRRNDLTKDLPFSHGIITPTQRVAVTSRFDKKDWDPDLPTSATLTDIVSLLLLSQKGNTPMAIANYTNTFQPCFEMEFILRFASSQFDRLASRYHVNVKAVKNARLLMLDSLASWGKSDEAEYYDASGLTANRRPPLLRYYYFARIFARTSYTGEEGRTRAALQAYITGISGLCIPASLNNAGPQAVIDEAVSQIVDKCHNKVYDTPEHLAQDCWILVAIYGMRFSLERITNHTWTSTPPYSAATNSSYEIAPFYLAARITQEICSRLEACNGIHTLI